MQLFGFSSTEEIFNYGIFFQIKNFYVLNLLVFSYHLDSFLAITVIFLTIVSILFLFIRKNTFQYRGFYFEYIFDLALILSFLILVFINN